MTFKDKKNLLDLIDEFHWYKENDKDTLYVFVNIWDMQEFAELFKRTHPGVFDEEGIECVWKGSYVCFPHFDDVLCFFLEEEEVKEMFEEEK